MTLMSSLLNFLGLPIVGDGGQQRTVGCIESIGPIDRVCTVASSFDNCTHFISMSPHAEMRQSLVQS